MKTMPLYLFMGFSVLLLTPASSLACPPSAPGPCYECIGGSWVKMNCVCCDGSCCPTGQSCCDEIACYSPTTTQCCGYGNGKTCPKDTTCCGLFCCLSNECCTINGCESVNRLWQSTSAGIYVSTPSELKTAVENVINSIPLVDGVTVIGGYGALTTTAKKRQCCSPDEVKEETCKEGTFYCHANVNKTIWNTNWEGDVDFCGGLIGFRVKVSAIGEINTYVFASGTAGYWDNPCDSSCGYGSVSMSTNILGHVGGSIELCVILFGIGYCADLGIDGFVFVDFGGSVRVNQCGACDGLNGALYITRCSATLKITWLGNEFTVGDFAITG